MRKSTIAAAVGLALAVRYQGAAALPQGGEITAGQGKIGDPANGALTIRQDSQRLAIDWLRFGIGAGQSVTFQQPGASAIALNRVVGNEASRIYGSLSANGQVFLLNPNGVLFAPGSQVNVGGLVASTLKLSNEDFMAGRYVFSKGEKAGSVVNQGEITANYAALLGPQVSNEGIITATLGTVALAAGEQVTLKLNGTSLVGLTVDKGAVGALAANRQLIHADGGTVILTAKAADALIRSVVNNEGIIEANTISQHNGVIRLEGGLVLNTGAARADGASGGSVQVNAERFLQSGSLTADGTTGPGGTVLVSAERIIQTESALLSANGAPGGSITVAATETLFSSATATATGSTGGRITLTAPSIDLRAAHLDASGDSGGGTVLVGGDWQGANPAVPNAQRTSVNFASILRADALESGDGGKVVVWSDGETRFGGLVSARGGMQSGDGGQMEVSGKENLVFGGRADAGAAHGTPGKLLLDPKNIVIDASYGTVASFQLLSPNLNAGEAFGNQIVVLPNGNVVVAEPGDSFGGVNAGAVYLFRSTTGALISALTGGTAGDNVGNGGFTVLTNGNFVVRSPNWDNGLSANAGAVTWMSATNGMTAMVSASNSLVGDTTLDQIGSGGVVALTNGNYVVISPNWDDNVPTVDVGAVTWGNGATGTSGAVDSLNSLIGSTASDQIGSGGVRALTNGNYVVSSPLWNDGLSTVDAGAATWADGTTGLLGTVTTGNSLHGAFPNDQVSSGGIAALTNGNYVVASPNWARPGFGANTGAATWGDGTIGITGGVHTTNSLHGAVVGDRIGSGGVVALTNGNYVVVSPHWINSGNADAGAVTWRNGTTASAAQVDGTNSMTGGQAGDSVGSGGVIALTNGHYVVRSPLWDNGSIVNVGAATWGDGTTGTTGSVDQTNSLVGQTLGDQIGSGGIFALTNGNYVVSSPLWNNGLTTDVGAATWGDGAAGTTVGIGFGLTNTLIGTTASDQVGSGGVVALTNGNYVVASPLWDNPSGPTTNVGAATWVDGTTGLPVGVSLTVSTSNSIVGNTASDQVSSGGVFALANGHYVVASPNWDRVPGGVVNAGAVTWGNGATGTFGLVSALTGVRGTTTGDQVGSGGVTALSTGNYVVKSPSWDETVFFGITDAGAATWARGNASGQTQEVVSLSNSVTGVTANDNVSGGGVTAISGDRFLVRSVLFDQPGFANAGAVHVGHVGSFNNPLLYSDTPAADVTITPAAITTITNTGTAVVLQANNDITLALSSDIVTNNPSGNGGAITLQAGRSVILNSAITTDNGNLTLIGNDRLANGVENAQRDAGDATIQTGIINAGTGAVTIELRDGAGKTNLGTADISLGDITAGTLNVTHSGASGNITQSGPALVTGTASFTASNGNVNVSHSNDFQGLVSLEGTTVTISDQVDQLLLAPLSVSELNVNAFDLHLNGSYSANENAGGDLQINSTIVRLTGNTTLSSSGFFHLGTFYGTTGPGTLTINHTDPSLLASQVNFNGALGAAPGTFDPASGGSVGANGPLAGLTINTANQVQLPDIRVDGNVAVTADNGNITQSGPALVTGTASFTASNGNVNVSHSNDFQGLVSLEGTTVTISDQVDQLLLAPLSVSELNVNAFDLHLNGSYSANENAGGDLQINSTIVRLTGNTTLSSSGFFHLGTFYGTTGPGTLTINHTDPSLLASQVNFNGALGAAPGTFDPASGGSVGANGPLGGLTINTANQVQLPDIRVDGNVAVTADNGNITQSGPAIVTGTASFTASNGNVNVSHSNDFQGLVSLEGTTVTISDQVDQLLLAPLSVSELNVNAFDLHLNGSYSANENAGGDLQINSTIVRLTGNTTLSSSGFFHLGTFYGTTGPGTLTINHTDPSLLASQVNFNGALGAAPGTFDPASGGSVGANGPLGGLTINTANQVQLPDIRVDGNVAVTADNGNITQSGPAIVTGTSSFTATNGQITLNTLNDFTGAVSLATDFSQIHTLYDRNDLVLGTVDFDSSSTLQVRTGLAGGSGSITQTGAMTGLQLDVATYGTSSNILVNQANQLGALDAIRLTNPGGGTWGDVSLRNDTFTGAWSLASMLDWNLTGNLTVQSASPISQTGALIVLGTTSINASNQLVDLSNSLNNFQGAVSLTSTRPSGTHRVTDRNDLQLGAVSLAAGELYVQTGVGGAATSHLTAQTAPITALQVRLETHGTTSNIILDAANQLSSATPFVFTNPGGGTWNNVSLRNEYPSGTMILAPTADWLIAGNFTVRGDSVVGQTGRLNVTGNTTFDMGSNFINLANPFNDFQGTFGVTSANGVNVVDANALRLASINTTNNGIGAFAGTTLTLDAGATLATTRTGPDALVLAAGTNFVNNAGGSALSVPVGGRWLVYSTSPAGSTEGGLASAGNTRLYNRTYASNQPATIAAGNHLIYSVQPGLNVSADNASRNYGDANPAFTVTLGTGLITDDGYTDSLSNALLTGAPATTATTTSPVSGSPYAITQGTLASGAGYALTFTNGELTLNPRPITVTADPAQSKVYGNADPAFTYAITTGNLVGADTLGGTLGRAAGENVGPYALNVGTLANPNYGITFAGNNFGILQRPITVTADPQSKVYGATDPALTYSVTAGNLVGADTLAGALARAAGEPVGAYPINQGTLANANYGITYAGANLSVTPAPLSIMVDPATRPQGAPNPSFSITYAGFVLGDGPGALGGSLGFITSANSSSPSGLYAITPAGLTSSNYSLTFIDGTLTITAVAVPVEPIRAYLDTLAGIQGNRVAAPLPVEMHELVTIENGGVRLPEGLQP